MNSLSLRAEFVARVAQGAMLAFAGLAILHMIGVVP